MTDDIGAFVPGPRVRIEGRAGGPLSGLTFAAKDLFDVAGVPTGGGNHDWPPGRPVPTRHSWAVQTLLDAGATLIGKTVTDEVSLGITVVGGLLVSQLLTLFITPVVYIWFDRLTGMRFTPGWSKRLRLRSRAPATPAE